MANEMAIGQTKKQAQMAAVLPADEWKDFNNKTSDCQGLIQLCFHAACAAVPAAGIHYARTTSNMPLLILSELALGFIASFYFMGFHEIIHMTAFRSKWLNKLVSYPIGLAIFRGPNWFWCFHWHHHRYTQDPDLDPEISGGSSDLMDPSRSVMAYCRFLSGWPFGFERAWKMATMRMQKDHWVVASGLQTAVAIESIVFVLAYLALIVSSVLNETVREVVVLYWLLPHMLGAGHLRFYQFAEHRGCETGDHKDLDTWGSTRTTTSTWLYTKLAWNMPFHIEHHSWPAVPFYLLPKLHQRIKDNQPEQRALFPGNNGYIGVHKEFLRRLRNGEPTSLPRVEHVDDPDDQHKPAALERRRTTLFNMADELGEIDMADVAKHNSKDDCWIVINTMVINATTFIPIHPGGQTVLAQKAGKDASLMFKMVHPEGTLEKHLPQDCIVGRLKGSSGEVPNNLKTPLLQGK